MRFVAVKSEQQQAAGFVFRTRDLLVRQRTQLINAIRGHLTDASSETDRRQAEAFSAIAKMGERTLRRLIIIGSSAIIF